MQRIFYTLLFLLASTFFLQAQDLACDGVRYLEDVFTDSDIEKTTVTYGENQTAIGTTQTLKMDIYEPEDDSAEARPAIILAFGGSFIFGQRSDMEEFCMFFARKGYVAATIDYRLYPALILGFPDSLEILDEVAKAVGDMKAAVRHLRMDAATDNNFKIDPEHIFVGGLSAGAITATHLAYMSEDDDLPDYVTDVITANGGFEGDTGDANNLSYSSEVSGVLNLSGGLHRKEWLTAGEPLIASLHGTNDGTVPFGFDQANGLLYMDGSGNVHPHATAIGAESYLLAVDGGGHVDIHFDAAYQAARDEFYENTLSLFHEIFCPDISSSDDRLDVSNQVAVYPNPSEYLMNFNFENIESRYRVEVLDQLGRRVAVFENQNDANFILEKEKIGTGLYFVNVLFEDATFAPFSKRIIFR